MVVGGYPASYDAEVVDLEGTVSNCTKPSDCPLRYGSVGTFMNGAALVCESYLLVPACYFYDPDEGTKNYLFV